MCKGFFYLSPSVPFYSEIQQINYICLLIKNKKRGYLMSYQKAEPFVAVIDKDGVIYQNVSGRKGAAVGIDLQREGKLLEQIEKMQDIIDNYYNKLVEVGVIVPPKTAEEVAKEAADEQLRIFREQAEEQSKINNTVLDALKALRSEIAEIKKGGAENAENSKGSSNEESLSTVGKNREGNNERGKNSQGAGSTK
jgi:hypothetical protein